MAGVLQPPVIVSEHREPARGACRGAAVALLFLAGLPGLLFLIDLLVMRGLAWSFLTWMVYATLFPLLWLESLSGAMRLSLTALQILAMCAAFGWCFRHEQLRAQVLYAMIALGAVSMLSNFLATLW